jgi:hypothetical protein
VSDPSATTIVGIEGQRHQVAKKNHSKERDRRGGGTTTNTMTLTSASGITNSSSRLENEQPTVTVGKAQVELEPINELRD